MRVLLILKIVCLTVAVTDGTCPSACNCWTNDGFNTVDCSFQRLVTIESELPKETQVLDLSNNNIMEIGDGEFCITDLSMLYTLNVSNNKIGQIHINGFNCLHNLKILDLSKNIVQYILPHWFWDLLVLEQLYLKHNDLTSFRPNGPFIESNTLEVLDISYCKLPYINNGAFKRLPNLKLLDLSGNFLYQLSSDIIEPLKNLEVLMAANNTFKCNNVMKKLARYCTTHGVQYTDVCQQGSEQKFQRMISKPKIIKRVKNSGFNTSHQQNCTVGSSSSSQPAGRLLSMKILKPHYIFTAVISFSIGISVGLVLGCWIKSSRPHYRRHKIKRGRSLIENCGALGNSTPVMYRKLEVKPCGNMVKI